MVGEMVRQVCHPRVWLGKCNRHGITSIDSMRRSLPESLLAEQRVGPLGVFATERRVGFFVVVDVVDVTPFVAALVEYGLKIEWDVLIRLSQGNGDGRQPLTQGQTVIFEYQRLAT